MTDMTQSYHYGVIRRAIDLLDQADAPLSLDDLAMEMGMSPAHFQRTFSKWVGVSPKRYQQYLAIGHAKTLLANRFTTLETAHSIGLSGSSRLHDLFLSWEAMSPGEFAKKGQGLDIFWDWADSPFGEMIVTATKRGICGIGFTEEFGRDWAFEDMRLRWPDATMVRDSTAIAPHARAIQ